MSKFKIDDFHVGAYGPPFIIAEMSGNHDHSLDRALSIVDAVADSGAHALKLQTYTADTLTLDSDKKDFFISDEDSLWKGRTLYSLYEEAYTPWEWHEPIFEKAKKRGLIAFSTPFDPTAVDFLEELNVPCYKIASFENNDLDLLKRVAATGKPLIASTGMASLSELDDLVRAVRSAGCRDLVLLKCTSSYPASSVNSNLRTIPHMRELFGCEVGLSDHTLGVGAAIASVALGASVIEKHFTLDRSDGGVDSAFSMEPNEFKSLVDETNKAHLALGAIRYGPTEAEVTSLSFRRSIYVTKDIKVGERFTKENIRVIRPGYGLPPKFYDRIIGRKARNSIERGSPLDWESLVGDAQA
ncbi:MAG: pseudaminic acid synthase [Burkholderiales bacterium]|nr:pseudaminic acid synthase [Burkholderiales bacterium]